MKEYLKRLGWDIGRENPDDKDWLSEQRLTFEQFKSLPILLKH